MAAVYTDISSVSVQFALIRDVSAQALFLDKILSHFWHISTLWLRHEFQWPEIKNDQKK